MVGVFFLGGERIYVMKFASVFIQGVLFNVVLFKSAEFKRKAQ